MPYDLAKLLMRFDSEDEWREFHEAVTSLRKCPVCEKPEEAIPLLQAFYDYSNPPSRMKNYDAYMDALQRTRVLLADWRKAHGNG